MIKKSTISIGLVAAAVSLLTFNGCKPKAKTETIPSSTNETPATTTTAPNPDASARYDVTFTPDSALIGKKNEMALKFSASDALELSDADGKSTGMRMTINFTVTNKNKMGEGSSVYIKTGQQRLTLDNGTLISPDTGDSKSADQESTVTGSLVFLVPAGARPVKLNLFEDETRNAVALTLTKKIRNPD